MLSKDDLNRLIKKGELVIEPFDISAVGCAPIDLSLGDQFVIYTGSIDSETASKNVKSFSASTITLPPNGFILGMAFERIRIPSGYSGFLETRGNFARAGITVSSNDGHIDPGTDSNITLEIHNRNTVPVTLYARDLICQLFIFRLSSISSLYEGEYSHQIKPPAFIP